MRLLLLLLAVLPALATAQYKWTDANGRVNYGDNPPRDAKNIERVGGKGAPSSDPMAALPFEVRRATAAFPLTLYTSPDCGPCGAARDLLRARGAPYGEVTLGTAEDIEAFRKLDLGEKVPVLMVGRQGVKEFNPDEWHRALDTAGYPRSAYLPPTWRNPAPRPLVAPPAAAASAPAPVAAPGSQ
jgi:glutaredoxin